MLASSSSSELSSVVQALYTIKIQAHGSSRVPLCQSIPCCISRLLLQLKVHIQASRARAWLVPGIVSSEPAAAPPPERISPNFLSFEFGLFQNSNFRVRLPVIARNSSKFSEPSAWLVAAKPPQRLQSCRHIGAHSPALPGL